jgi:hypothetical protein
MKTGASSRTRATISAAGSPSGPAVTAMPPSEPEHATLTKTTYRALLLRGLRPTEAANLTAFLCGIRVGNHLWKLDEVNRLLFLRELQASGRLSLADRSTQPPLNQRDARALRPEIVHTPRSGA